MKKGFVIGFLMCLVMLSGCTDDDENSNESADMRGAVEADISDFESYTDSVDNDIVFDFKNPEDKDKVVITQK